MANIIRDEFKERKSLEEIFLEYRPYNLREILMVLNLSSSFNPKEEDDDLDDELLTIDLKSKEKKDSIESELDDV